MPAWKHEVKVLRAELRDERDVKRALKKFLTAVIEQFAANSEDAEEVTDFADELRAELDQIIIDALANTTMGEKEDE